MADRLTPEQRSENMRRIRSGDTKPELAVRSTLHSMGYRFRLHRKDLPGTPDIVMPKYRTVIFVHGCYWHRHGRRGCKAGKYMPKTNTDFYRAKFRANVERDRRNSRKLQDEGWRVIVIWECETRDSDALQRLLESSLAEQSVS